MTIGIEAAHANKINRTGVEEYCFQIIQYLKKIIPADVRVILYTNEPLRGGLENLPPNWQEKVLSWSLAKFWSQIRLSWEMIFNKPDIFFAPGQLIPFFCPKKTAVTIHDSAFLVFPRAYHFFGRQYLKWMNKRILKKAKVIFTPSDFSRRELQRLYNYSTERVSVTPLGINQSYIGQSTLAEQNRAGFLAKFRITKPFFISVGRLEDKKNSANIVRSFDLVRAKHDCQLLMVGTPGCGFEEVQKAIEESKYKSDIIMSGWLLPEEISKLYSFAVCLLFPSKYEGFGLPVLEAMASGCPVIASENNSLSEVGADASLYAEQDDVHAISALAENLLINNFLRQELAQKGLLRARQFSWENTAKLTWQCLSELVK